MNQRRLIVGGLAALLLLAAGVHHPTADVRLRLHDAADLAPRQLDAAVDLGLFGVRLLVTWTAGAVAR